jgi:hypothetical protein
MFFQLQQQILYLKLQQEKMQSEFTISLEDIQVLSLKHVLIYYPYLSKLFIKIEKNDGKPSASHQRASTHMQPDIRTSA